MSQNWLGTIRECFDEITKEHAVTVKENEEKNEKPHVPPFDPTFHSLDSFRRDSYVAPKPKPCHKPCCKRRRKTKKVLEEERILNDIFTKSKLVPQKVEVPLSHLEGAGINIYKDNQNFPVRKPASSDPQLNAENKQSRDSQSAGGSSQKPLYKSRNNSKSQEKKVIKGKPFVIANATETRFSRNVQLKDKPEEIAPDQNGNSSSCQRKVTKGKPFKISLESSRKRSDKSENATGDRVQ